MTLSNIRIRMLYYLYITEFQHYYYILNLTLETKNKILNFSH
jgi:hypothetical protein